MDPSGRSRFSQKGARLAKEAWAFDKKLRDLVFSESVCWVDLSKYLGVYLEIAGWKKPWVVWSGSTIRTLLHGKINPKDWLVLSLGDVGFLLFFRVVSGDYGKPCWWIVWGILSAQVFFGKKDILGGKDSIQRSSTKVEDWFGWIPVGFSAKFWLKPHGFQGKPTV